MMRDIGNPSNLPGRHGVSKSLLATALMAVFISPSGAIAADHPDPLALNFHLMHPDGDSKPGDPNAAFHLDGTYHLHYILAHDWTVEGKTRRAQETALAARLAKLGQERDSSTNGRPVRGGRPAGGPPSVEHMFQVMDRDRDGELSKAEFRGPPHVFAAADKDNSGRVTRAEMEAFRARTGPGGSSPRGPGRSRTKFTTPHALDPTIIKEGHNLVTWTRRSWNSSAEPSRPISTSRTPRA
jgi:hypothetical protein